MSTTNTPLTFSVTQSYLNSNLATYCTCYYSNDREIILNSTTASGTCYNYVDSPTYYYQKAFPYKEGTLDVEFDLLVEKYRLNDERFSSCDLILQNNTDIGAYDTTFIRCLYGGKTYVFFEDSSLEARQAAGSCDVVDYDEESEDTESGNYVYSITGLNSCPDTNTVKITFEKDYNEGNDEYDDVFTKYYVGVLEAGLPSDNIRVTLYTNDNDIYKSETYAISNLQDVVLYKHFKQSFHVLPSIGARKLNLKVEILRKRQTGNNYDWSIHSVHISKLVPRNLGKILQINAFLSFF